MLFLHDLHWITAALNSRTCMLKPATDGDRTRALNFVRMGLEKIMKIEKSTQHACVEINLIPELPSLPKKY